LISNNQAEQINFRLPDNLVPILYDFHIKPYIGSNPTVWPAEKDYTFEGYIEMHLACAKPTNKIVFHAADMVINENTLAILSTTDPTMTVTKSVEIDKRREFVTVTMSKQCVQGANYTLSMTYDGNVLGTLYGFYRSSYIDNNGNRVP